MSTTGEPSRRPHVLYAIRVPSSVTMSGISDRITDGYGASSNARDRGAHRVGEARRRERVVGVVRPRRA